MRELVNVPHDNNNLHTLRKKCPYSEFRWSVFFRTRTECGKIQTRKTPTMNTFHSVIVFGGEASTPQKSQMESFAIIVNDYKSLTIIAKLSILDVC